MVITIEDDEEDQEVKKEPIVTSQDDGEEDPPSKKHKLCRDLLKRLPPSISVIRDVTL